MSQTADHMFDSEILEGLSERVLADLGGRFGAARFGKFLDLEIDGLHLITHLSRAGWLRWSDKLSATPLKPGKNPTALRVHLGKPGEAPGFGNENTGVTCRPLWHWALSITSNGSVDDNVPLSVMRY